MSLNNIQCLLASANALAFVVLREWQIYYGMHDNPVDHNAASNMMVRNTYLHRLPLGNKTQGILAPNDSQAFLPRGNP